MSVRCKVHALLRDRLGGLTRGSVSCVSTVSSAKCWTLSLFLSVFLWLAVSLFADTAWKDDRRPNSELCDKVLVG